MRRTIKTTATYQIKRYANNNNIQITKNDIVVGVDSLSYTWVLIKQIKGRKF